MTHRRPLRPPLDSIKPARALALSPMPPFKLSCPISPYPRVPSSSCCLSSWTRPPGAPPSMPRPFLSSLKLPQASVLFSCPAALFPHHRRCFLFAGTNTTLFWRKSKVVSQISPCTSLFTHWFLAIQKVLPIGPIIYDQASTLLEYVTYCPKLVVLHRSPHSFEANPCHPMFSLDLPHEVYV